MSMKAYNIYYNNERINNRPLTKQEVFDSILNGEAQYIYKKNNITNAVMKINKRDIKVVECIVI